MLTAPGNEYTTNYHPPPEYAGEVACLLQEWLYGGDYNTLIAKEQKTPDIMWVKQRSEVRDRNVQVPYCRDEACRFGGVD